MTPSSEPQGLPESLSRARRDIEAWRRACVEEALAETAPAWVREDLETLMQDNDAIVRFLRSESTRLRRAAISLVGLVCPRDQRFLPDAIRLAFEDPEPTVRGAGLAALWRLREHVASSGAALVGLLDELFAASPQNDAEAARFIAELRFARKRLWETAWRNAAGAHAPRMGENREFTRSYLTHRDPEVRCAAIIALQQHWEPSGALSALCEELSLRDPDVKVRALALACLSGHYAGTNDKRVAGIAARLARDGSEANEVRIAAYRALLAVRSPLSQAAWAAAMPTFQFPEEVDWRLVDEFL